MLTKEEYTKEDYLKAKEYLQMANDYPNSKYNDSRGIDIAISMFEQLIKEHFELVKKYDELYERHSKILDDVHDYRYETQSMKITIRNLCKHFGVKNEEGLKNIYLCKPYKFEDLKELIGKPIFDYKYKEFYILAEVKEEELYKDEWLEKFMICSDKKGLMRVFFEEGRFFPPTKAMEYQE